MLATRGSLAFVMKLLEKYKDKIHKTNECWLWVGNLSGGYAKLTINTRPVMVHRRVYEQHHNKRLPKGLVVMHICDNKLCVNPSHLKEGTNLDNIRDHFSKNRGFDADGNKELKEVLFVRLNNESKNLLVKAQMIEDFSSLSQWARRVLIKEARKVLKTNAA